jgi:hypothetical protein
VGGNAIPNWADEMNNSIDQGSEIHLDTDAYAEMFKARSQPSNPISGICGRVMRGRRGSSQFDRLSFAKGRRLAWITGPVGMQTFLNLSDTEIVLGIGKDRTWLDEKLREGMEWKLAVIPQAACELATWDGLFNMIQTYYPIDVAAKLLRWKDDLADTALVTTIEAHLTTGNVKDDPLHKDHMSEEAYLACEDTAVNARLFLWHSLGVNDQFTGTGYTTGGVDEYLMPNLPLAEVREYKLIDLHVGRPAGANISRTRHQEP